MNPLKSTKTTCILASFVIVMNIATVAAACQIKPGIAQISDAHIHHGLSHLDTQIELQNFDFFALRKLQIISFPMPVRREKTNDLISLIDAEIGELEILSEQNKKFQVIRDNSDFYENINSGQLAVFLGIEFFHGVFNGDPTYVEKYRKMGIRSITIISSKQDRFFTDNLLSVFGKRVIRQMNAAGILVDISHLSEKHMIEVINFSTAPVIASHSGAKAVSENDGNLSDVVLEAMRASGGYVFTTFNKNGLFLPKETEVNGIERFIEHVVHLTQILESDHVGIGSDYQAMGKYVPFALNEINAYQQIEEGLQKEGFTVSEIGSIMSGTFLKAMGVCQ